MGTHLVRPTRAQIVMQRLDEWQVRRHPLGFVRTTQEDVPIVRAGPLGKLKEKARFANPWLTSNKHDAAVPATGLL
jgi:hypothetical protein